MGIRLVGYALSTHWSHLSERARLVLAQMCYVAKDTSTNGHAPGTYWGGHHALIVSVLGKDPDALSAAELEVAERMMRRAFQELTRAGAITLEIPAARGRMAVYRVHPDQFKEGSACG